MLKENKKYSKRNKEKRNWTRFPYLQFYSGVPKEKIKNKNRGGQY